MTVRSLRVPKSRALPRRARRKARGHPRRLYGQTVRRRRRCARGAAPAALAALAVGDAAAPAGRQSRREPPSQARAHLRLRAHLAARLGASRLLRVVVSGPGAAENPEDSRLTAASARAFLRAMLMLRFDRGLGGTKNERTIEGFRDDHDAVHARACSLVVRAAAEGLRDCARVDGAGVASVVAGEDILAATGTPNAATALAATAGRIETKQTPSPSRDDALAAAAALAVVVDVATRRPEWVAALSRGSGVVRALAGFLDRESFVRAREAANEPLRATVQDSKGFADFHDTTTVAMHETRIFHDTALPPPFAYPFVPVQTARAFKRDDDDVDDASETETDSERKTKTSLYLAEGGFANARLVAADVFAAIAAVAPARVVAADSRAARALVEMVAGSRARRAAATAAARALWSLGLAEGDGAPRWTRRPVLSPRSRGCWRRPRARRLRAWTDRPCPRIWLQKPRARRRRARWERCLAARRVRATPDGSGASARLRRPRRGEGLGGCHARLGRRRRAHRRRRGRRRDAHARGRGARRG